MWFVQALQKANDDGTPSGVFHLVAQSDEGGGTRPGCDHDHRSAAEAEACEEAQDRCDRVTGIPRARPAPSIAALAGIAYDAYKASTGGKTFDGREMPTFSTIREKTPHVAAAWEAAVATVLKVSGGAR
jgi:hypothetical protein